MLPGHQFGLAHVHTPGFWVRSGEALNQAARVSKNASRCHLFTFTCPFAPLRTFSLAAQIIGPDGGGGSEQAESSEGSLPYESEMLRLPQGRLRTGLSRQDKSLAFRSLFNTLKPPCLTKPSIYVTIAP
jgi:hypothetical protein